MRLYNTEIELEYELSEEFINLLYVENREAFFHVVRDIWQQSEGKEGSWILSAENGVENITKKVTCVLNPLFIDCNDKRLLKELYQSLNLYLLDERTEVVSDLNSRIVKLLDDAVGHSPFSINYNLDMSLTELFKLYNVRFDCDNGNLVEMICSYIKLWHRVAGVDCFVFVDLKAYLSELEIKLLYEMIQYEKVYVLLIESHYELKLEMERVKIYDIDRCIIDC